MSYFPFCFPEKFHKSPALSNLSSQIRIFRVICVKGCPTGVLPRIESKSRGTVTEKGEKKEDGLPFFGIDPAGKSPEQIEREWFENYYRGDIPQLTVRAVLIGARPGRSDEPVQPLCRAEDRMGTGGRHHRLYPFLFHWLC